MINDEKKEEATSTELPSEKESRMDRKEQEALKIIEKRTKERMQRRVMKLRKIALTTITLSVISFLVTVFSGIGLYYWYNTKVILNTSMFITRFTAENLNTIKIIHSIASLLTLVLFFIFIVLFLNFQKLYSEIPHQGKTRKISSFIVSTVGLVAIVLLVLNFLTGTVIPDKDTTIPDTIKSFETKKLSSPDGSITSRDISIEMTRAFEAGLADKKEEKVDLNFMLHTSLLPILFGILIFIILFDVYTLQKAKFREITPKIKPH